MSFLSRFLVWSFTLSIALFAQSSAGGGNMQGAVKDATGAVLPGARIAITHLTTARVTNNWGL